MFNSFSSLAPVIFRLEPPSHGDNRLDKLLALALAEQGWSRARLQALIKGGHVRLDGHITTDPAHKIRTICGGDVRPPPAEPARLHAEDMAINAVYEDSHVLVVDKPAGLTVHPGAGNNRYTLANALQHRYGDSLPSIGGVLRPGIVHRLDKDTSGLLVVAKSEAALQHLAAQFAAHTIGRKYKALVKGVPNPLNGEITKPIGRDPRNRKRMHAFATPAKQGKPAITHYRTQQVFGHQIALLECRLQTGRTHQIRAHLAALQHPLLGDQTYGRSLSLKSLYGLNDAQKQFITNFRRQALHAETLSFIHPHSHEKLDFTASLPADFAKLLEICDYLRVK